MLTCVHSALSRRRVLDGERSTCRAFDPLAGQRSRAAARCDSGDDQQTDADDARDEHGRNAARSGMKRLRTCCTTWPPSSGHRGSRFNSAITTPAHDRPCHRSNSSSGSPDRAWKRRCTTPMATSATANCAPGPDQADEDLFGSAQRPARRVRRPPDEQVEPDRRPCTRTGGPSVRGRARGRA